MWARIYSNVFTTERRPLWNTLKPSYLPLDRKSHTESKIAGKVTKPGVWHPGGEGARRPAGVGRGGAAVPLNRVS